MSSQASLFRPALLAIGFLITLAEASSFPQPKERIAIVGAGPSGIFTAYLLGKAGYDDIHIFESSFRPGGFISTVPYKNVSHDMSTYAVTPAYWRFIEAAENLGAQFCPFTTTFIARSTPTTSIPISVDAFLASTAAVTLEDPTTFPQKFQEQLTRYSQLWSELFEQSFLTADLRTDRLFPANFPTDPIKQRKLGTPIIKLLREEGLELLIPVFRSTLNPSAYGPADTTAAVYAMAWTPPSTLLPGSRGASAVPCGEHDSFQRIVDLFVENLAGKATIHYGSQVRKVIRSKGKKRVKIVTSDGSYQFDRVVVTAKLPTRKWRRFVVEPISKLEEKLIRRAESLDLYTVLLEGRRNDVIAKTNLLAIEADSVARFEKRENFFGTLTHEADVPGGPFHSDLSTIVRESGLFFFNERRLGRKVRLTNDEKNKIILRRLSVWDRTKWTVLQGRWFRKYFQRWTPDGVRKGLPWGFSGIQGKGKVYYVSSYACGMESVGHVFDCAVHLVNEHF